VTPKLYLKKGTGWHQVVGVVDVRVQPGKFVLEDGTQMNGDIISIIMDHDKYDDGQTALRKLLEMEPRVVEMRIKGQEHTLDAKVILCGDDIDAINPKRYSILRRVLGFTKPGTPTWAVQ